MFNKSGSVEPNYINWDIQQDYAERVYQQLTASNFQDMFSLTKRLAEMQNKMSKLKFRAQGIGGMIGMAAGALGGPLGGVVGFGIGRSVGSFLGNGLAQKYYGEEQSVANEYLFLAKQRDTQLKYQQGMISSLGGMIETLRSNSVNDDKKVIQDMMVL
ncbi:MAG: hypothetical protein LW817_01545 [Candidatus Caenarcaniphilales bacterium]|jgi:hypothetical protein|nr:hypothetical protein [Candidatus Caenarcaniphilales bacterium]